MPQIEVIVSPAGESQVKTVGFAGPSCRTASEFLEQALGTVTHDQLTSEFHQDVGSEQHHVPAGQ